MWLWLAIWILSIKGHSKRYGLTASYPGKRLKRCGEAFPHFALGLGPTLNNIDGPHGFHVGGIVTSTEVLLCLCDGRRPDGRHLRRHAALADPCQDVKSSSPV